MVKLLDVSDDYRTAFHAGWSEHDIAATKAINDLAKSVSFMKGPAEDVLLVTRALHMARDVIANLKPPLREETGLDGRGS